MLGCLLSQIPESKSGSDQKSVLEPTGVVSGLVMDGISGKPVSDATVAAYVGGAKLVATTTADGSFSLAGFTPGRYSLAVFKRPDYGPVSRVITVVDHSSSLHADIKLVRNVSLIGRVLDQAKAPLQGIRVKVLGYKDGTKRFSLSLIAATTTDSQGMFRLSEIRPNERYVLVADSLTPVKFDPDTAGLGKPSAEAPKISRVRTYYPNSLSIDGALRIDTASGENQENLNITMQEGETYCISGTSAFTTNGQHTLQLFEIGAGQHLEVARSFNPQSDTFRGCGFPAGQYEMVSSTSDKEFRVTGYGRSAISLADRNVSTKVSEVRASAIQGRVIVDGTLPPARKDVGALGIRLLPMGRLSVLGDSQLVSTSVPSEFSLIDLFPGEYELRVSSLRGDLYVKNAQYGVYDLLREALPFGASQGELVITVGTDGGAIRARSVDKKGETTRDGTIIAVPSNRLITLGSEALPRCDVDQDGTCIIINIKPGKYYLIGFQELPRDEAAEVDRLLSSGDKTEPVEVTPGKATRAVVKVM